MPFIQNVGRQDILEHTFKDPGPNSLLIQICDVGEEHIPAPSTFSKVVKFNFDDVDDDQHPAAITIDQAFEITMELRNAYAKGMNVIVHCYAGIYRSGAVALAGEYIGFNRIPPEPGEVHDANRLVAFRMGLAMGKPTKEVSDFERDFYDQSYD